MEKINKLTLRDACQIALALGQDEALIKSIERGEIHPAMAAFGLWRNEHDLDNMAEEITTERE
jgi:hypothetical protein